MVTAVRANPALYRAQLDPLVKNACYVEIRKECGRQNLPSAGEPRKQMEAKAKRRPSKLYPGLTCVVSVMALARAYPQPCRSICRGTGEGHLGPHADRIALSNEIAAVCQLGGLAVPPPPFWSGMLDLVGHVGHCAATRRYAFLTPGSFAASAHRSHSSALALCSWAMDGIGSSDRR
jgi:hypothetical protein